MESSHTLPNFHNPTALRASEGCSPICTGENLGLKRYTGPPRTTYPRDSPPLSHLPDKEGPFPVLSFPAGSCWVLRARVTQSCHLGIHRVALIESWWVPLGSSRWLRVQALCPRWAHLYGHHMTTLNAQGASIHTKRLAPSPAVARKLLPDPRNHPTQGQPHMHLQPDPSHRWPVPSGVGTSQATMNRAVSRAQHFTAEQGQMLAQEGLMTHINK